MNNRNEFVEVHQIIMHTYVSMFYVRMYVYIATWVAGYEDIKVIFVMNRNGKHLLITVVASSIIL